MEKVAEHTGAVGPRRPVGRYDYARWSFEELRQFAVQMRVRDACSKSRSQLVELFDGSDRR